MAAVPNFEVKEKEFYELHNLPPSADHPHPQLRGFKIIMVSKRTPVGNGGTLFVCKWPSMESLARFFKDNIHLLPTFDEECTMTEQDVLLLLTRHIDPVNLCLVNGRLQSAWLDNQGVETLNAAMNLIEVERTLLRPGQLYVLDYNALPQPLRDEHVGVSRIGLLIGVTEDPSQWRGTVDMRIPTRASLDAFLSSESLLMPDFDRVINIDPLPARFYRMRVLPIQLYFQLRKRLDFWIIE